MDRRRRSVPGQSQRVGFASGGTQRSWHEAGFGRSSPEVGFTQALVSADQEQQHRWDSWLLHQHFQKLEDISSEGGTVTPPVIRSPPGFSLRARLLPQHLCLHFGRTIRASSSWDGVSLSSSAILTRNPRVSSFYAVSNHQRAAQ